MGDFRVNSISRILQLINYTKNRKRQGYKQDKNIHINDDTLGKHFDMRI